MNNDITKTSQGDFEVGPLVSTDIPDATELAAGMISYDLEANQVLSYDGTKWVPMAMEYNWNPNDITMIPPEIDNCIIQTEPSNLVSINNDQEELVRVNVDGTIEFSPNYNPTEAAQIFWQSVAQAGITEREEVKQLEKLVETACSHGHYDFDEYLYGMANGLILALAVMKNEEPRYLDRPEKWLWSQDDSKNPPLGAVGEYGTQPEPCTDDEAFYDLPEVQEALTIQAGEIAKSIDDAIIDELLEEDQLLKSYDYERAMKGI